MIAYASRTGNVRYIVAQLGLPGIEIGEDTTVAEPFLLLTYTDGLGQVPEVVQRFMERSGAHCRGVAVSGNRNFGHVHFGRAGDAIAARWNVPLVRKLELRGFRQDYEAIRQFYLERIGKGSRHEIVFAN
ncbi:MAG: class Ib ribonucleoside-diphosphate reductase assembly flavoprotein NrdI [Thermobacillus sp.]|uniref:Ribonucleoside-diphosphate reductase 2, operon protein nrdI n=1 Tax=Thermobacillus composti (strain DSM 18247 / JCM 13945 / KWC4) TaxID=717605 RepID=L0EFH7_THECK|nr:MULTISPECIES: class Ib ribonucleoside-diphosphate reductase assembly flavoprotein NrdI [Thermobacillus]AGA58567.1 ribonucleoside-diphosphate reductase 2, operon protein nrdI [Thermobacillus composti KWC4]REK52602.1 MAG: class Ib ribonucleoside-diphosphate reductase assembly flavoprotein NrdI [Thermobacillus sp.]